ncbi:PREDICTED: uncharacterized protein LOC104604818 [Nelumbo nucifera]|uniref:Uncharacterized protein LOC104604818 n=1 Tax=Nelumbo nucifera TaxID=4432 RepID=A0A1U8AJ03_NELNU|nr:PREDICTED: uncharacterized protein LOC104604818 [Nelumbo nucifera]
MGKLLACTNHLRRLLVCMNRSIRRGGDSFHRLGDLCTSIYPFSFDQEKRRYHGFCHMASSICSNYCPAIYIVHSAELKKSTKAKPPSIKTLFGVYESFDTICIYLESDQSVGSDPDKKFWVRYRMVVVNQKNPAKTVWKESSICTKTWNNFVFQFMKVSDMLEPDARFLVCDIVVIICEIIDCCSWFEFSDLENSTHGKGNSLV